MTKEEFLELMGKGSEDEDKKLIEAIEKVFEEKGKELEHSDESEDYIMHYGRKGMKWGQNIFEDERQISNKTGKEVEIGEGEHKNPDSEKWESDLKNEVQLALDYISAIDNDQNPLDLKVLEDMRDSIIYLAKKYSDSSGLSESGFERILEELGNKFKGKAKGFNKIFDFVKNYKSGGKILTDNQYYMLSHFEDISEALEHHGIDGQKWGVRNGPPYPLERQKGKHLTSKAKAQLIKDNIDDLSLEEIEKLIKRIKFEEELDKMTAEEKKKGNSFASQILQASGKAIVSVVVPAATTFAIKKLVQKYGGDDNLKLMFPNKK